MAVYNRIFPAVRRLISVDQHGFMAQRSTVTNLVQFTHFVSNVIEELGQVDVVYTDFSKAFDRINHAIILRKLSSFGFSDSLLKFFKTYLTSRRQFIGYNGFSSEMYGAPSGVPQGSNLGPLLFLLFVNDLSGAITCKSLFFADDLKIYHAVKNVADCGVLQQQLDILHEWCLSNKLDLNIAKCKVMSYSRKRTGVDFTYCINGIELSRCDITEDLGVMFDSKLTFAAHIEKLVPSAMKIMGFIIRNCKLFTSINAMKALFNSLVRCKLEYCSLVWYPFYQVHVLALESVQRKFLKHLSFRLDRAYPQRGLDNSLLLSRFNVESLNFRRILNSLIFLHKLLHGDIDSIHLLSLINFRVPRSITRLSSAFYCQSTRTNIVKKSPIYVMTCNFNAVAPLCDVHGCSVWHLVSAARIVFPQTD